jgi:hypothetical protein
VQSSLVVFSVGQCHPWLPRTLLRTWVCKVKIWYPHNRALLHTFASANCLVSDNLMIAATGTVHAALLAIGLNTLPTRKHVTSHPPLPQNCF